MYINFTAKYKIKEQINFYTSKIFSVLRFFHTPGACSLIRYSVTAVKMCDLLAIFNFHALANIMVDRIFVRRTFVLHVFERLTDSANSFFSVMSA